MAVPLDAEHVELRHAGGSATTRVFASPVLLNPSDVTALVGRHPEPGLLIVPAGTPAAREAAEASGWSWLVDNGQQVTGVLRIAGHRVVLEEHDPAARNPSRRVRPGRVPWGALTLVRRLIERPYTTQRELAALVGISQPRVSQSLAALVEQRLVERSAAGWRVRNFDELVRWGFDVYPGPGGFHTFWYGLDQPSEQAHAVFGLLGSGVRPASARVTAPRRRPGACSPVTSPQISSHPGAAPTAQSSMPAPGST